MKGFACNLERRGRWVRAILGLLLGIGAAACWKQPWLAALLGVSALFTLFEAWRGWCVLRACGIKTKL